MTKPLLRIVMISHENTGSALRATLESLTDQTYKNTEITVIDANEWDSAASLNLQEDITRYPNARYYQPPRLPNMGALRNEALDLLSCDYVSFVTGDEVWDARKAELQVYQLEADAGAAASCCGGELHITRPHGVDRAPFISSASYQPIEWLLKRPVKTGGQMMYRFEALKSIGGFHADMDELCDLDAMIRLQENARILFLPLPLLTASVVPSRRDTLTMYNDYGRVLDDELYTDMLLTDRVAFLDFNLERARLALKAGLTADYALLLLYAFARAPVRSLVRLARTCGRLLGKGIRFMWRFHQYRFLLELVRQCVRSGKLDAIPPRLRHRAERVPPPKTVSEGEPTLQPAKLPAFFSMGVNTPEHVIIPDHVRRIGKGAFAGCATLTSITIPDSVRDIEDGAFMGCINLRQVIFGEESCLINLGDAVFAGCLSLESICMPGMLRTMGKGCFAGCRALVSLDFYRVLRELGAPEEPAFPRGLQEIPDYAFAYCQSLKRVRFGSRSLLTRIGAHAFEHCASLEHVWLDAQLREIAPCAFQDCAALEDFVMVGENALSSLGAHAFMNCVSLTQFIFPPTLQRIERGTFHDCRSLRSVRLPINMAMVRSRAFSGCAALAEVFIDNPYTHVKRGAFERGAMLIRGKLPEDME